MAALMGCLALLSQSRGTALAVAGSLLVVLALVPGRTRNAYLATLVGLAVALASPPLLHVYVYRLGNDVVWVTPSGVALVIDCSNGKEDLEDKEIAELFVKK